MAILLDGEKLSKKIFEDLKQETKSFIKRPKLAVILVGENPSSKIYVNIKQKRAKELGFDSIDINFPADISQDELLEKIKNLNNDDSVNAILLQLPLPEYLDKDKIINSINPKKDVDGFHFENTGKLVSNQKPYAVACTARGIIELLKEYNIKIEGKSAVVIGRSNIVGTPVARLLQNENATVTVCHSKTKNIGEYTKSADIVVCAVGKPKFLKQEMVKNGVVIVDVGITRLENKIVGDVDFDRLFDKASYISPVPKGVGPMTIAGLMQNTLDLYKLQNSID